MNEGEQIRQKREALGWSQRELSRRSGVAQGTISTIESGKPVKSKLLLPRLLAALERRSADPHTLQVPVSPQVLAVLKSLGGSGLYGGVTPEDVAAELIREAVRRLATTVQETPSTE
jgi:transcriptional regulator with XRE-family HTH domain